MMPLLVFFAVLFVYSLASRRLERTVVTAPIVFTVAGMLMFPSLAGILRAGGTPNILLHVAEIGLVLLLFTDASRTDLKVLHSIRNLPARLLSTGMLLTILLGAVVGKLVFPELSIWEAGILSAILAPTDAGLGQVVVTSPRVPVRIRQALNVEAGLNDGLSVPFLLLFAALSVAHIHGPGRSLVHFIVEQLGIGVLVGLAIGLPGGWLLDMAYRAKWMTQPFRQIGVVTLPLLCLLMSDLTGASMFIASFVAGLAVQVRFKEAGQHSVEFAEEWGQFVNLGVFFLFGMAVVRDWSRLTMASWGYALLSLTVVRMVPVAVALIGTHLSAASVVFMGWFGPRGLSSIVLGLVYLEQQVHMPGERPLRYAIMATVALSIFAHGLTAVPGIDLYARRVALLGAAAPEHRGLGA
ncbi:MAG TPA: cation:proton antiporter [Terriglobales bacterium]